MASATEAGGGAGADVALVIDGMGSGGAQKVVATLANAWARQGRRVCVVTFAAGEDDFFALDPAVRRRVVGGLGESTTWVGRLSANLRRVTGLRRALRESGAPVVVSFILPTNVLAILAARGLGLRVVISERNDPARQSLGPWWDALRRLLYRFADVVSANSLGAVDSLRRYVPEWRLAYLPNPLPPPGGGPGEGPSNREALGPAGRSGILAVGRLMPQKGQDVLLRAVALLAAARPDVRLEVVGDGPSRDGLEALAGALGIGDRVAWHGRVADVDALYRRARAFALPSRFEGTPNALLEAMGHGLAVVVTDASPGPLEVVEHERTGLVVPVDDPAALAAALGRLLDDAALCRRLGAAAAKRVRSLSVEAVLPIWSEVLGLRRRDGAEAAG